MTGERKKFFEEQSAEYLLACNRRQVYNARGLVKRILDLHTSDILELRFSIRPLSFYHKEHGSVRAGRLNYKHGALIALEQPKTQEEAFRTKDIPLVIRARSFSDAMKDMKEEDINFVGYRWYPVQGKDRRKRVVPFVWVPEGARIFAYAENYTQGITLQPYEDAARVKKEGAEIVCEVPSRTQKKPRYRFTLQHVPIDGVTEKRAIAWCLKSKYESGEEPLHSTFNIRYTGEHQMESSDVFTFYPHDIAAYTAVIKHYNEKHNLTPIEMIPLPLISRMMARFATRLCNNIVVYDPTLENKQNKAKLRKLHLDERSILIARAIKVLGHDATMYWDPLRDGKLKDYTWNTNQD